jgi:hypothetical protein
LPHTEIQEITHVISKHSPLPIYCIHHIGRLEPFVDEVWAVTANSVSMDDSRNGLYRLKKEAGHWHLIEGGLGLSTSLVMCDDTN